jgi:hypothetical protein
MAGLAGEASAQTLPEDSLFRLPSVGIPVSAFGARVSAYEANDSNTSDIEGAAPTLLRDQLLREGWYSGLEAQAGYVRRARRSMFSLLGSGEAQYSQKYSSTILDNYGADAQWTTQLFRHTSLAFDAGGAHRSAFRLGGLTELRRVARSGLNDPGLPSPELLGVSSRALGGRIGLVQQLSSQSELLVDYGAQHIKYESADVKLWADTARARFNRNLPKGFDFHAGYAFTRWDVQPVRPRTDVHRLDGGLGYAKDLARHVSFRASTGADVIPRRDHADEMRLALQAGIETRPSPAWQSNVQYSRGLSFLDGVADPVSYDRIQGDLDGQLTRTLRVSASAGYSVGSVLASTTDRSYDLAEISTTVETDVSRRFGLFARYRFYHYEFGAEALLRLGVPSMVDRHSAMVGLTASLWMPLQPRDR